MTLEDRLNFMAHAILNGRKHLEDLFGDFNENLETMEFDSKEFLFGHVTGMMEVMRVLMGEEEE